jgi:anti-sigma B factor antagonist
MALPQPVGRSPIDDARERCAAPAGPVCDVSLQSSAAERVRLHLSGELDVASAPDLRAALDEQLAAGRQVIEIDATGLRFCDAAGLGVLVAAEQRCQAIGAQLRMIAVSPTMARLLSITGLTGLLPKPHLPDVTSFDRKIPEPAESPVRR